MDPQVKEYDGDCSAASTLAINGSPLDQDIVETPPKRTGHVSERDGFDADWFQLGLKYEVLKANCLAMKREFCREPKNRGTKSRSLSERVEDAWHHSRPFFLTDHEKLVEEWGAATTLFLENRMAYLHLKTFGDELPAEDEVDTRRKWPPADLPKEWFDFEKSFDLLLQSKDALVHECALNNIRLPGDSSGKEEAIDFDSEEGCSFLEHARLLLESRGARDWRVRNYWRIVAFSHMEDLLQFYSEMAFVNAESV